MANPSFVLTFDDLPLGEGQETRITNGYAGFNWTQAGAYNPDGSIPGYVAGSGQNIAFIAEAGGSEIGGYEDAAAGTPFVLTRATPFDVLSADFTAAFRDALSITVSVFADEAGTELLGTVTLTADRGNLQTFDFDETLFTGARRIEFNANDGNGATLDYFGLDNLTLRDTAPTIIDFDDVVLAPGGEAPIEDGFAGFQWTGVGVYAPDGAIPGYQASSGSNIGFIAEADGNEIAGYEDHVAGTAAVLVAGDEFQFLGGTFSAAFRDDLDLTVRAYADAEGTVLLGTATVQIDRGAQAIAFEDGVNVDGTFAGALRLEFASNDGNGATRDYFGFDDLTFFL